MVLSYTRRVLDWISGRISLQSALEVAAQGFGSVPIPGRI